MHAGMLTARKHCNAHAAYAKFRSALELLEPFGLMSGAANAVVDAEHNEFVRSLEGEYRRFLTRYQQTVGTTLVLEGAHGNEKTYDNKLMKSPPAANVDMVKQLQRQVARLRQDKFETQQRMNEIQRQLDRIVFANRSTRQPASTSQPNRLTKV